MKKFSKIAIVTATLVTMGSLAACQSTNAPQEPPSHHMMGDGPQGKHAMKHHKLTPEQRAERQAQFEQIQQACVGKVAGQAIQVKMGDKTIDGTCQLHFKPNKMDNRMMPPAPPAPVQAS
ncbi:hypothetical protein [Acinetobacter ursingii]|uniref:hypothetical protein n=1 Tax=Acinetobacter ursingii TaxID=108980 RepID=UPI001D42658A|nr:hypothetical protein [Acinetobacter ursingii]MCU4358334.1 hypothetical protein [Acinetobacter ursingii]NOZ96412.1 hypothetical protein [Gammaproteobacteria bacterium]